MKDHAMQRDLHECMVGFWVRMSSALPAQNCSCVSSPRHLRVAYYSITLKEAGTVFKVMNGHWQF